MPSREISHQEIDNRNKVSHTSRYRPEIDGLRAFAVVAVIINHFNKELLPGGYLGVDIFFVISGYVITSSLYLRPSKDFKDFLSGFYERRIKRLVPALSVFVLITGLAVSLCNPNTFITLRTGLTSLFGLSNLYLFRYSTDYFAQSTELNVFTHTWSLGVEEQFYMLFPFLIWFSGFGRQTINGVRNLMLIVGTISIVSLILFLYLYPINQPAAYFLMPTRFWEMSAGSLVFGGLKIRASIQQSLERVPPLLVLVLIVAVMYLPMSFAPISTIAVVVLSSILITCLKEETALFQFFTNPKVVYVGLISYSLYLWHWGVLSISRWTIGVHWWSVPFQVLLILALAVASYRYVETPLRSINWFVNRWKTFAFGGGVLITVTGFLVALGKPLETKMFIGSKSHIRNMLIYRDLRVYNDPNLPTLYLIGDSHSGHYGEVMSNLAKANLFNLVMHPLGLGLDLKSDDVSEHILAPLREYKDVFRPGDFVVFSADKEKYNSDNDWIHKYKYFLSETKDKGLTYFLVSPTPRFPGLIHAERCSVEIYRPYWSIKSSECFGELSKSKILHDYEQIQSDLNAFLIEHPNVNFIDTFGALCPDSICSNTENGIFLYIDGRHLSSYGSMKTKNVFLDALNAIE